jgi:hypothetical protein
MKLQLLACWRRRSVLALVLCMAFGSGTLGCGSTGTLGEVEGVVSCGGKPLADVQVVFYPDPEAGGKGPRSVAHTDSAGHYRLSTDSGTSGAVVGMHRVCLFDLTTMKSLEERGLLRDAKVPNAQQPPAAPSPASRIPPKYSAAGETPLRGIAVQSGVQTIDLEVR